MGLLADAAYLGLGVILSPWLAFKMATDATYRHRLGERFGKLPESGGRKVLWIHGASVGEIAAARTLARRLKEAHPGLEFHVTALTPAGRERAAASFPESTVSYFPFDAGFAVRRALGRVRPAGVVLIELEVWPNFLERCEKLGIPVAVVNGRMSERSFGRYRRLRGYFSRSFRRLAAVGAQNETYAERMAELGANPVVTGNLKYDAHLGFDVEEEGRAWRGRLELGDAPVLVAGSTHEPEERLVVEAFLKLRAELPDLRLIVAPRHLNRVSEVEKVIDEAGLRCYKSSLFSPGAPSDGVILLDTVGELARLYSAATAVFIGGTFCARGGQNMLEPAALGRPIVSGPSVSNFEDVARTLTESGGMRMLDDAEGLAGALGELLRDPEAARRAGALARDAVGSGRGALDASAELVEKTLLKGW